MVMNMTMIVYLALLCVHWELAQIHLAHAVHLRHHHHDHHKHTVDHPQYSRQDHHHGFTAYRQPL